MAAGRIRVNRLQVGRASGRVSVRVELSHGGQVLVGDAEAGEGTQGTVHAAAAATVLALNKMLPAPWELRFDHAAVQAIAEHETVIVQLRLRAEEVEERLVGSAVSDRIPEEAAVRAVLNAAERRATRLIA